MKTDATNLMQQQKRILLIDDEIIFLKATSNVLSDKGYKCDLALNSISALEKMRSNHYDLLISDIKMPGNSNMELISKVSKISDNIPIILVTAYPSIDNAIQAIQLPVYGYLLKPIDYDELLELVRKVLSRSSLNHLINSELQKKYKRMATTSG